MDDKARSAFAADVERTALDRRRVRELVAAGRWKEAEPIAARAKAYADRHVSLISRSGAESIVGSTEDFQRASFLSQGAACARSVGYVEVNYGVRSEIGTGFLISPSLFITNHHVIEDATAAKGAQVTFFREMDDRGRPKPTTTYLLDPDRFALFSPDAELDYAVIALGQPQSGGAGPSDLGFCPLSNHPDKHVIGMNTNIVQHPSGWPKMITVRNNILTWRTDHTLLYETDTEQGSSGSPVFNDDWQLVALHHWGEPFIDRNAFGTEVPKNVNEGVRISAIYMDLARKLDGLPAAWKPLLQETLAYQDDVTVAPLGPTLSPPRPSPTPLAPEALSKPITAKASMTTLSVSTSNAVKLTIPLEITVSVGGVSQDSSSAVAGPAADIPKLLTRGAEAVKVDQDYADRRGYSPQFIPDLEIDLPTTSAKLAAQIAALRPEEPRFADGELKYEHFSLKMNKTKRIAAFTATNIDGRKYLTVDRGTGLINNAEGEVWFKDPRISASFFLDQTFYSAWSAYFDRGHLTRRTDPTWGTDEEAERANADTFHFTNCSPQHFRFNQSAKYWQGLERYVLENGVLAEETKRRITVFQGPIFNDKIDLWADDVQIPSSFFKIVVWKGVAGPKAVGLVVDQLKLLNEARRSLGAPQELASVDVNHWRVPISKIEAQTSLDFGDAVRQADTIGQGDQPNVGEAMMLVTSFESIRL